MSTNQPSSVNLQNIEITYSPSRVNNYKVMRKIAVSLEGLSDLSIGVGLIFTIIVLFVGFGFLSSNNGIGWVFVLFSLFNVAITLIGKIIFSYLSESINVSLDIEANTRQAAKTLEKLLRSQ